MKNLVRTLVGLLVAIALVLGGFWLASSRKLNRTFTVNDSVPTLPEDSASIERGRYLTRAITKCVNCHGESLGGQLFIDAGPLGKVWSANLTRGRGGIADSLTPAQWAAAVRHGVARSGRPLLVMPSANYNALSDEDLGAIVAFINSLPPVDYVPEKSFLRPLGWFLYASGKFPTLTEADLVDHQRSRAPAPARAPTAEYGKYLAEVGACTGCHGPTFSGGPIPGMPPDTKPASNLTPTGLAHYTETDFFRALREGTRPGGTAIDTIMPWRWTKEMTDDDIRAVFAFLKTVPAKEFGGR